MRRKIGTFVLCVILLIISFSGCTDQNTNQGNDDTSSIFHDEIQVTSEGGNFSIAQSTVGLDISNNAINGEQTITIDKLNTSIHIENFTSIIGYIFQPTGFEFFTPITLELFYDDTMIPQGVNEEDLKIYLYENDELTEIDNCLSNPNDNVVRGNISRLYVYWLCCPYDSSNSSGTPDSGDDDKSDSNTSSIYEFEVNSLEIVEKHWVYPEEDPYWENYRIDAFFVWYPTSYVRFYEVTWDSTGSFPASSTYLNWNDYKDSGYPWPEGELLTWDPELYIYGDYEYYPGYGEFVTTYDNLHGNFPGQHGIEVFTILAQWDVSQGSSGYVPPDVIEDDIIDMRETLNEWTQGWFITVRAVS